MLRKSLLIALTRSIAANLRAAWAYLVDGPEEEEEGERGIRADGHHELAAACLLKAGRFIRDRAADIETGADAKEELLDAARFLEAFAHEVFPPWQNGASEPRGATGAHPSSPDE